MGHGKKLANRGNLQDQFARTAMEAGIKELEMGKMFKDGYIPGTRDIAHCTEVTENHVRHLRAAVLAVLSVTNDSTAWVDAY